MRRWISPETCSDFAGANLNQSSMEFSDCDRAEADVEIWPRNEENKNFFS